MAAVPLVEVNLNSKYYFETFLVRLIDTLHDAFFDELISNHPDSPPDFELVPVGL